MKAESPRRDLEALARWKAELPLVHPACALIPFMTDNEFLLLAEDIRKRGLRTPIVMLDGLILDGKCRWIACRIAGVEPTFEPWVAIGDGNPFRYVYVMNILRASYTDEQLATFRVDFEEARSRATASNGTGGDDVRPSVHVEHDPGPTHLKQEEEP